MNTLIINNKKIDFVQPEQILNMGGPWICKMLIENNIKLDNVLIDNIVTNDNKLYFIKYIEKSKWQRNNFFQLFYFDSLSDTIFVYKYHFKIIYIESIIDSKLVYYESFHNKDEDKKRELFLEENDLEQYI